MKTAAPVWIWPEGAKTPLQAGMLERDDASGASLFRYDRDYVAHGGAALDPDQLRHINARQPIPIPANHREGIPGIVADAGPDAWGRHVLAQELGFTPNPLEALIYSADDGAGNLCVGELAAKPPIKELDLVELAAALARSQAGLSVEDRQLQGILSPDTALGGAKPKATVFADGHQWIAKYPERGDPFNLPYYEAAAMRMAARLGIETASVEVAALPVDRSILLVKRFDRGPIAAGGRLGFASAMTVLGAQAQVIGPARSYLHLAKRMRPWLREQCDATLPKLWSRIAYNALVANGDDHPRNHGFIHNAGQWQLSPAFDIVPTWIHRERLALAMPFLMETATRATSAVTAKNLIRAAPTFHIAAEAAQRALITMAQRTLDEFAAVLRELNAPASVYRELTPMLDWTSRILSEASSLSPIDCGPAEKRKARWKWSP